MSGINEWVLYEKEGYKARIIINRPDKLNAVNMAIYKRVGEVLDEIDADPEVRVVIIKGNGKAFSAGYDINDTAESHDPLHQLSNIEKYANGTRWKIWNLTKPVIAQLHGYCLGGGCEMILPCDFLIGSEDLLIGEPEIQFGENPAYLMIPWVAGLRKSKELLLTGTKITGVEAERMGLITRAVPGDKLEQEVEKLADELIKIPAPAMYIQKRGINRTFEIMGLNPAIGSWADMGLWMGVLKTPEVIEFNRITKEKGVKAALVWRDEHFAR
ncbi:MAG: enoyl-CoA hydratase/isomerase family protein [Clostridiaceae bacterium]|nr:enoyl-CoA hydratase/isomerase family protein [Clostridiaceae bacterium]